MKKLYMGSLVFNRHDHFPMVDGDQLSIKANEEICRLAGGLSSAST